MANTNVTASMARMPVRPIAGSSSPARTGEKTPGPDSTSIIMPLARPRCRFGTMTVMAAMYAGHWNAPLRP